MTTQINHDDEGHTLGWYLCDCSLSQN